MKLRLTGQLLDIEHYSGDFDERDEKTGAKTGQKIIYGGTKLHVLVGREVVVVKAKDSSEYQVPDSFKVGNQVDLYVDVTAQAGARGAYVNVNFAGPFAAAPAAVRSA